MMNEKTRNFQGKQPTYKKGGSTMITKMKTLMKNQKGMTLIELLAVIVIIAIIALIAIPAIGNIINNSKDKALLADAQNIVSGAKIAIQDDACTSDTKCTKDDLEEYVDLDSNNAIDYGVNVSVTKDATTGESKKTEYKVFYSELANIKNEKKYGKDGIIAAVEDGKEVNISAINKVLAKKAKDE